MDSTIFIQVYHWESAFLSFYTLQALYYRRIVLGTLPHASHSGDSIHFRAIPHLLRNISDYLTIP